jgi:hypothetical protein
MSFRIWLENEIDGKMDGLAPASAEVRKTGLQPQVDAQEIRTKQKDENDKLMAVDGHMQRIQAVIDGLDVSQSPKLQALKQFCQDTLDRWSQFKTRKEPGEEGDMGLGEFNPSQKRVQWMMDNQPLPEDPRMAGPGIFGNS